MAYKAEIAVNVRGLKDVRTLESSLNKISGKISAINKISIGNSKAAKIEEKVAKSKEAQRVSMIQTRRVGDAVQRGADKGLQTEKALAAVKRAAKADAQGALKVSIEQRKIALEELKAQQQIAKVVKDKTLTGFGPKSPVFGRSTQMESAGNTAAILQDPTTSVSPVQQALAKMEERSARDRKQAVLNRKKSLSLGKDIVRIKTREANLDRKRVASLTKETRLQKEIKSGKFATLRAGMQGPALPPVQGPAIGPTSMGLNFDKRTGKLLRGPAGSGGGGFRNLARRFDTQSALISGGFPLLFGQGPVTAAAGALGGGIGGMFGQMGGFAGGIAATAAVQAIQSALDEISKLGQAMGAFTQDTQAMTTAMGLQGSAQEAQLKRIERTQGKTAAFNASMKMMENRIGTSGVRKIKEFGETTRVLGTIFSTTLLRLQAFMGGMANFIARLIAGEKQLKDAEINQTIKDAAAGGNLEAQSLLAREREIAETGFKTTQTSVRATSRKTVALSGTKEKLEELERDKELFAIRNKVSLANDEILSKSQDLVRTKTDELDLQNRIKEEMAKGTNKELATALANVNQIFDKEQEVLQSKVDQSKLDEENAIKDGITGDKLQQIKDIHQANTLELEKHNKLRGDAIKLEKDLALATDGIKSNFEKIGESIASGVSDNLTAAILQTKTLGDAAKSILNDLANTLVRLGVNTILKGIAPNFFSSLTGFADGGRPPVGKASIVGEKGPELFVPKRSGTIIPNDKLGAGSTNINVNIDASGSSVQGDAQQSKELGRAISAAIQSELLKQKRPGGLLA